VKLYRRGDCGEYWYCSYFVGGKNRRKCTETNNLSLAKEIAEDWFLGLRGKSRAGLLDTPVGKTFDQGADAFEDEYEVMTNGERSPRWVNEHRAHLKNHLRPFFGKMAVAKINGDTAQQYRMHRIKTSANGKAPARNTLANETITLRMVLKTCVRKGWITGIPSLSSPYRKQMKVVPRPWFNPEEYKKLYKATGANAKKPQRDRDRWNAEQLHDLILFLANTGLRPDEVKERNLFHQDIKMVKDEATGELLLVIEVRGKRGRGVCKSRAEAVKPYQRLLNRPRWQPTGRKPRSKKAILAAQDQAIAAAQPPKPTDPVFPGNHIKVFNKILVANNLKFDRDGRAHTLYSLRHYYICQRLTEGANVYEVAKNCRTSVEMIQKYYAVHIANQIDAAAVNTRRLRPRRSYRKVRLA
jgi:integrase